MVGWRRQAVDARRKAPGLPSRRSRPGGPGNYSISPYCHACQGDISHQSERMENKLPFEGGVGKGYRLRHIPSGALQSSTCKGSNHKEEERREHYCPTKVLIPLKLQFVASSVVLTRVFPRGPHG